MNDDNDYEELDLESFEDDLLEDEEFDDFLDNQEFDPDDINNEEFIFEDEFDD